MKTTIELLQQRLAQNVVENVFNTNGHSGYGVSCVSLFEARDEGTVIIVELASPEDVYPELVEELGEALEEKLGDMKVGIVIDGYYLVRNFGTPVIVNWGAQND